MDPSRANYRASEETSQSLIPIACTVGFSDSGFVLSLLALSRPWITRLHSVDSQFGELSDFGRLSTRDPHEFGFCHSLTASENLQQLNVAQLLQRATLEIKIRRPFLHLHRKAHNEF